MTADRDEAQEFGVRCAQQRVDYQVKLEQADNRINLLELQVQHWQFLYQDTAEKLENLRSKNRRVRGAGGRFVKGAV